MLHVFCQPVSYVTYNLINSTQFISVDSVLALQVPILLCLTESKSGHGNCDKGVRVTVSYRTGKQIQRFLEPFTR